MFKVCGVEGLARNVSVSGRIHFRVEIGQLHIDSKRGKGTAERSVAATRIKPTRGKSSPNRGGPNGRLTARSHGVG
jgi:hypothetical protein